MTMRDMLICLYVKNVIGYGHMIMKDLTGLIITMTFLKDKQKRPAKNAEKLNDKEGNKKIR